MCIRDRAEGFFKDLPASSKPKIARFPRMYYRMENGPVSYTHLSYDGIPAISVVVSSNSFASIGGLPQTVDFLLQEFVHYA